MNADSIKIECEEDGFILHVEDDLTPETFSFRIADPEALYDTVKREIGPWLYERDQAHAEMDAVRGYVEATIENVEAYDRSDPKSPEYHSVHADIYDNREKV